MYTISVIGKGGFLYFEESGVPVFEKCLGFSGVTFFSLKAARVIRKQLEAYFNCTAHIHKLIVR